MSNFKIRITTGEGATKEYLELAQILINLRITTKYWQTYYGSVNRVEMKRWEDRADKWIEEHKIVNKD